jgi:hypothetical protein
LICLSRIAFAATLALAPASLAADPKAPPKAPAARPAPAPKAPAPKAAAKAENAKAPEVEIPGPEVRPAEIELGAPASGADITVYTNGFALIREPRNFHVPAALTRVTFNGVSKDLQPETALFQVLKGGPVKLVEQNFNFDQLTPETLLERSVGHEVTIAIPHPPNGPETLSRARVLSTAGGAVVEMGGKIYSPPPGHIVYDSLPAGLRPTPALVVTLAAFPNQDVEGELSYLTGGIDWRADYVLQYDADAGRMDLNAWATITNRSGMDFRDARLKLIAGAAKRVAPQPGPIRPMRAEAMMASAQPKAEGVDEESFVGNHIYSIARPTTLASGETKQLALLSAQSVSVKRELVVRGDAQFYRMDLRARPQVPAGATAELSFKNTSAAKLGTPLPAGVMRIYAADAQGAPQFVGESRIDHIAEGEDVTINAGRDYDVPVTREQTSFVHASDTVTISAWRITVRNAKARPVPVKVIEAIPGGWEILKENNAHTKTDDGAAAWDLQVPPKGQVVLEYNVKIQS